MCDMPGRGDGYRTDEENNCYYKEESLTKTHLLERIEKLEERVNETNKLILELSLYIKKKMTS